MSNHVLSSVFRAIKGLNPLGSLLLGVMLLTAALGRADTAVLPLNQWINADIGTTPLAGSGVYNPSTTAYTISGSGADIWRD